MVVLVVDDDSDFRGSLKAILGKQGYLALEAGDGIDALKILQQAHPSIDLLLTDVNMPRMDGLALAQAARDLYPEIPILLMSGQSVSLVNELANLQVLRKPIRREALLAAVRNEIAARPKASRIELQRQLQVAENDTANA